MMNIVQTGDTFKVFGESIQTHDKLPSGTYGIAFNQMTGYSLFLRDDLEVDEKLYGDVERRVNKILNSFEKSDRNLGVILSGKKGSGKSMTARLLAKISKYPVIICDCPTPGLSDFLSSIKQEVIVLFDEFEKHFPSDYCETDDECGSNGGPQANLLSLFDGIDAGKKLFVITTNNKYRLNEFFLNRPGRFHYLFEYNAPGIDEIREYLEDNLNDKSHVDEVLAYSTFLDLTFDTLRAICFDINLGYSVKETILDLNLDIESKRYTIKVTFTDNSTYETQCYLTLYRNDDERIYVQVGADNKEYNYDGTVYFNTKDIVMKGNQLIIPAADVDFKIDSSDIRRYKEENGKEAEIDIELKSFELHQSDADVTNIANAVNQMYGG